MNIITQAETDNIGYCYIPFLYHDEFPGMDIKFPNGVKVEAYVYSIDSKSS